MNRFAIEEDDQFEIHVKQCSYHYHIGDECMYNAAEEVMLRAQQGKGCKLSFILVTDVGDNCESRIQLLPEYLF